MGQYFKLVNFTREEQVLPHKLDSGIKFAEIMLNKSTAAVLLYLIYGGSLDEDSRMPPDVFSQSQDNRFLGRWTGEDIALVGDYAPNDIYEITDGFKDISEPLVAEFNKSMKFGRMEELTIRLSKY